MVTHHYREWRNEMLPGSHLLTSVAREDPYLAAGSGAWSARGIVRMG